jgi:homoserine kinase
MSKKRANPAKTRDFSITLPATSANLGPAFDAAALALSMFLHVRAKSSDNFSIIARGRDAAICGEPKDHLILTTYREILEREGKQVIPLSLRLDNEIPVGKGCGSSAAARLAGIVLANHFARLRWTDDRIIAEAARREGHLDNAAACWMGGVAVGKVSDQGSVHVARILPKGRWPLLLAVSDEILPTEQARQILPERYTRGDAVHNIQNSVLLLAALTQGRRELLAAALEDRIHQPYRAQLCPLLPALQQFANSEGILGAVLSGAGPSVLMFLDPKADPRKIKQRINAYLAAHRLKATLIDAAITPRGATQSSR